MLSRIRPRWLPALSLTLLVGCRAGPPATSAEPLPASTLAAMTDAEVLCSIAEDIEDLRPRYPQLIEFRAKEHCDAERLVIGYQHHCDPPAGGGGWRGATPDPRPDGIWMYIDLHDPSSMAQIHTQPVVPARTFRALDVMVLMVEGSEVPPVGGEIEAILGRHGVTSPR